ncbi:MAG: protein phosphatase 2C domain-containing protein, partial [Microcoleus sp. SU_5_3]|nr:protein phosphatase 2C domain-containing protein [Microcoleus sp. SU_5_3]
MTNDSQLMTNWQVVAASVTGTSHEKRSQPCQDAHCWRLLPNNVLAAAVADGAGSAALAEIGAKIAV